MFDDPKLRLRELEAALKATELEDLEVPEEPEAEPDWLQEAKDLLNTSATEKLPIRNKANNYGRAPESVNFSRMAYADEQMSDSDALYVEKPRRKGAGGLIVLAFLELIAMGGVVLWWIRWTL